MAHRLVANIDQILDQMVHDKRKGPYERPPICLRLVNRLLGDLEAGSRLTEGNGEEATLLRRRSRKLPTLTHESNTRVIPAKMGGKNNSPPICCGRIAVRK